MAVWFSDNLVNIIIIVILVSVVGLVIRGMIRDRKAGKSSCGGNCASCGLCSSPAGAAHDVLTRVTVDGMMCGMCEAHINEAVRKAIPVKKVRSSHTRGETLILTEGLPDREKIRKAIEDTGYTVVDIACRRGE